MPLLLPMRFLPGSAEVPPPGRAGANRQSYRSTDAASSDPRSGPAVMKSGRMSQCPAPPLCRAASAAKGGKGVAAGGDAEQLPAADCPHPLQVLRPRHRAPIPLLEYCRHRARPARGTNSRSLTTPGMSAPRQQSRHLCVHGNRSTARHRRPSLAESRRLVMSARASLAERRRCAHPDRAP